MRTKPTDLKKAYKTEKDGRLKIRIQAVCNFFERDKEISEIADMVMCSENSVREWIRRFDEGGIEALRDLPRSGRKPKASKKIVDRIFDEFSMYDVNPVKLRQRILDVTRIEYSMCQIRRILHRYNLSKRKCQSVYINHATPASVHSWQYYLRNIRFPCLEEEGFTIVMADEAFFVQNKHYTSTWGPCRNQNSGKIPGRSCKGSRVWFHCRQWETIVFDIF